PQVGRIVPLPPQALQGACDCSQPNQAVVPMEPFPPQRAQADADGSSPWPLQVPQTSVSLPLSTLVQPSAASSSDRRTLRRSVRPVGADVRTSLMNAVSRICSYARLMRCIRSTASREELRSGCQRDTRRRHAALTSDSVAPGDNPSSAYASSMLNA